jgi:hypothetical protein
MNAAHSAPAYAAALAQLIVPPLPRVGWNRKFKQYNAATHAHSDKRCSVS